MDRLWCDQEMPECGAHKSQCSSGSVKSSDDGIGETRVTLRSGAMRLRAPSAGHSAVQQRRWQRCGGFSS
ncbi:hypothetical protein NDU88_002797 [Pleurodeles waltl]|uniref:Uncharacterized protein n=1 Tax=Pleurodeles waltl TaxID=8319 RepID=A0AAV7MNQ3_PLEWA|nr:hypothetical protein NDU88_002797 [Pleurodeles waltl]